MFQKMFQKIMLEKCCAVVKRCWWHMNKNIIYWENYYVTQHEILTQVFKKEKIEIDWYQRVVKEKEIFRRKYADRYCNC